MNPAAQWYFESLELYQILCIDGKTEFNLHTFKKNEWKGKKVGFETLIETPLRHHDLAKLTGLSRQMLTNVLRSLKRENLIIP